MNEEIKTNSNIYNARLFEGFIGNFFESLFKKAKTEIKIIRNNFDNGYDYLIDTKPIEVKYLKDGNIPLC